MNRIISEEGTATRLFLFSSKLFQAPTSNNHGERKFHMSVSPRPEERKPHFQGSRGK